MEYIEYVIRNANHVIGITVVCFNEVPHALRLRLYKTRVWLKITVRCFSLVTKQILINALEMVDNHKVCFTLQ